MLTGSLVSSLQGEPRATHDVDFVVQLAADGVPPLHVALSALGGYVDERAMHRALREVGMFNYIDEPSGLKVDFWMLSQEPFDSSRFARRRPEPLLGVPVVVSTPEDTILAKLRWAKLAGGSEKQFTDALRVFEVQGATLDRKYLASWADALGVTEDWERLVAEARPLD